MASNLKSKLDPIRKDINAALVEIAKKHGLQTLTLGKCTYDPEMGNFTFELDGVDGLGLDKDGARLNQACAMDPTLPKLGTEFKSRGDTFVICGINTTLSKIFARVKDEANSAKFVFETYGLKQYLVRQHILAAPAIPATLESLDIIEPPAPKKEAVAA